MYQGEAEFVYRQKHPIPVEVASVERAVRTAPEPLDEGSGEEGREARCMPHGDGELRNPWSCRISYRSGASFRYDVSIRTDGSFEGQGEGATGTIEGCCVTFSR